MNGRPGDSAFRETHPALPAPGSGLQVGGMLVPAQGPGGLWLPLQLLRLRGQARVYPGIPGLRSALTSVTH